MVFHGKFKISNGNGYCEEISFYGLGMAPLGAWEVENWIVKWYGKLFHMGGEIERVKISEWGVEGIWN